MSHVTKGGEGCAEDSAFPDQRPCNDGFGFTVGTQPGGRVGRGHSGVFVLGAGTAMTLDAGKLTLALGPKGTWVRPLGHWLWQLLPWTPQGGQPCARNSSTPWAWRLGCASSACPARMADVPSSGT
ncbi:hypothetical protein CVS27_13485 [Arthrobacter glacialis]|uniref:Uncharacterized protein n=1 Tax=Arthrobacter glacialis TaxID=1664 RepID=A0A2S3ZUE6_ARTGL|nr:hypothetical protein CVS27_13485 [Arthrobacter glacialis]